MQLGIKQEDKSKENKTKRRDLRIKRAFRAGKRERERESEREREGVVNMCE